ncbi:MAG: bifunctional protein-serine/threonine kinase/phosphatase [Alphaproteobacteria bacterium]|nr:bifunctional protein-serine/threonine kinase/phosphatase [Alphaproteobacteria bacterium]
MAEGAAKVNATVGFCSETGPRSRNEDFAGVVFGAELPEPRRDVVAAIADGIGGAKGGRVAAEIAVRGFLDGFCDLPETMEVRRAAARIVDSLNGWLYSQARHDPELTRMGSTFTALVLRGRVVHLLHVGDTRAYRLRGDRLVRLTVDHVREDGSGKSHVITRALGVEAEMRLDYASQPVALHDRFLLCSDGVHGVLGDAAIADILRERSAPGDTARALVKAALEADSGDNCTALVLDVVRLPTADSADIGATIQQLPVGPVPVTGETIDGFVLKVLLSEGRYSRLFGAIDEIEGGDAALKFPKPQVAAVATYRAAFLREAWVGARVNSPWVGRVIELPPGRQTRLYTVMPLYQGELLETRLGRSPALGLEEGRGIAIKLAQAAAALHRAGIIHRDIKPDNVILEGGDALKLVDLGVVRIPGMEDFPPEDIPGTAAYMAPEMFAGEPGTVATDIYALGVTMFRAFTGEFPYDNADAVSSPRRERPKELSALRPDLPAWLQAVLGRAIAKDPADRFRDMSEFAGELEAGPAPIAAPPRRPQTLLERAPVRFWQGVAVLLGLALLASLIWR